MAKQAVVISHWYQLFENFQSSTVDFYKSVESAVATRLVPDIHWTRIEHKEGGLASANREYLRMHRGKHAFDICAAPFGTGFFISWWFTEPPLPFAFLYTLGFLFAVMMASGLIWSIVSAITVALFGGLLGWLAGGALTMLAVPSLLWFIGNSIREGVISGESTVLAMPLIGSLYERIFAPATFYNTDTGLMFQESVHNSVLEVIDCLTQGQGVRALSDAERKPIMKRFSVSV